MKKIFFIYLGCLLLTSCHKDYKPTNKAIKQDSTAYGSPKQLDTINQDENQYQYCVVGNYKWTPGDIESILLDPGADWIIPGIILEAKSLQDGGYTKINGDRKPIKLVINTPIFNKTSIVVPNPAEGSLTDSIAAILKSGTKGSVASDVQINAKEVYSKEHLQLLMRAKYSGGFASLDAGFNFSNTSITSRYLIDVAQVYYTIFMETPSDGLFKKRPKQITESSYAPVYVSSVKYGRRIMISIETLETDQRLDSDFRGKMNAIAQSGSLDLNIFTEKFFSDKSIKVLVKGGNAENTFKIFKVVANKGEIADILEKDAIWSLNNLGVPLAYQIRNSNDNSNFWLAQAGEYKARMCTVKTQNDTTIQPTSITNLCLVHSGGQDRNFGGNPMARFSLTLNVDDNHRNIINCRIESFMIENGGDRTAGSYSENRPIIVLPDDFEVTELISPNTMIQPDLQLGSAGFNPFIGDPRQYPVSKVVLIGDSSNNNDDDLCPCGCTENNHAQINLIDFYPIKFRFTRKVRNQKT